MKNFGTSVQRTFKSPAFLIIVVIMGISAATMNSAIAFLALHFKKLPVPLRVSSLREGLPRQLGHWVAVSVDTAIDPGIEHALATDQYVFRDYVDTRKVSQIDIDEMKDATVEKRAVILTRLRAEKPSSVIRAAVTYYTGLVDTVSHIPERCFIADGFEVKPGMNQERPVTLGMYADGTPRDLTYRFLGFEDQTGMGLELKRVARNVGYVFHCNGRYANGPFEVRGRLQNLFERYGYYAKIELMTAAPLTNAVENGPIEVNNRDESMVSMEDFMAVALPEIEKCLPDWKALHQKK